MTNFVFHGDDQLASRQALNQAIKIERGRGVGEVIRLDASNLGETELRQALESHSLFGQEKLVVVDKLPVKLIDILAHHSGLPPVFIWADKILTVRELKQLPNFTPKLFKVPALMFKFLDALRPDHPQAILSLYLELNQSQPTEAIFYFLHRRISQLIQAKDSPQELKLADWQKARLSSQAHHFSLDQLLSLHRQLLEIDDLHKTGATILPLSHTLELFLLNL